MLQEFLSFFQKHNLHDYYNISRGTPGLKDQKGCKASKTTISAITSLVVLESPKDLTSSSQHH
jgi:hypothetical protein